jgi:superfamily I DNA/RNA helicase
MTDFTPTDEQLSIISYTEGSDENLLVNALAGTGKTTTLDLIQAASPQQPVLCLAFNKRIAEEMAKRFASTTTVRTFNSLGHRVWASAVGKVSLDPKKTQAIFKDEISSLTKEDRQEASDLYFEVIAAVSLAKSLGYVPEGKFPTANRLITTESFYASLDEKPSKTVRSLVDTILFRSIKASYDGLIDFNDQVYMSALFGGTFPRFPHVLVDEAQDLSPVNHTMLDKLAKGRITVVGDRWQSIYGFRGAFTDGIESLKTRFSMSEAALTTTFRCPKAIVEHAQWRVPDYKWVKDGGQVETLSRLSTCDIPEGATFICRNNAPLFRLAFRLLSAKRSVSVAGSDVGPRVINLLRKIGADRDTKADLEFKIDAWLEEKLEKAQNNVKYLHDMADCMKVFAGFGSTLASSIAYAEDLFRRQGTILLTTGHKAKGLEWDTVYILDEWLIGKEDDQEKNLRYVCQTRAKERLFYIDSEDIH